MFLNGQMVFSSDEQISYQLCESKNLLNKTQDWLNQWKNVSFLGVDFQGLREGSVLTIKFRSKRPQGYSYALWDAQWRELKFTNVEKTDTYIKITLTEKESAIIGVRGLTFGGQGLKLSSIKYTYFKPETPVKKLKHNRQVVKSYMNGAELSLPVINVTTVDDSEPGVKGLYQDAVVDLFKDGKKQKVYGEKSKIKARGNSTILPDEKPYRINFSKKKNLLGLNGGKKFTDWVLLRSQWDLASDYTGLKLAQLIFGNDFYASDCAFVHLFINGIYKGVYLLCEQNQVSRGRVDISVSSNKKPLPAYFFELDNYPDEKNHPVVALNQDEKFRLTDVNNQTRELDVDYYSIKNYGAGEIKNDLPKKYLSGVWKICFEALVNKNYLAFDSDYNLVPSKLTDPKDVCSAVVDLDSLVNVMLLDEIVRDNDVGAGSFFMAVDLTRNVDEKYGRLTFEAPWDFNWAYTEAKDDYAFEYGLHYYAGAFQPLVLNDNVDRSNFWYTLFNTQDWFRKMVRDKWEGITKEGFENLVNETEFYIDSVMKESGGKWPGHIFDFLKKRLSYIEENLFL